jgi:hypothetical protein
VGGGMGGEKGVGGWIQCKVCVRMYEDVKMIPVETIPGIGGE